MAAPLKLDKKDFIRWGWIALAAAIAAVLDVITIYVVPDLQTMGGTMALVATALVLLVDLARRYVTDTRVVKALFFVLSLSIAGAAYAQTLVIPASVEEHSMVKITFENKDDGLVIWDVYLMNGTRVVEKVTFVRESVSNLIFTGPPGAYLVKTRLIVSKDGKLSAPFEQDNIVNITPAGVKPKPSPDVIPTPTPVPVPVPVPEPDDPDTPDKPDPAPGRYGYVLKAYQIGKELSPSLKVKLPEIASNFESVSASVSAGGIKSVQIAFKEAADLNTDTIKNFADKTEWKVFFTKLDDALQNDLRAGKIQKLTHVSDVFMEICEGLRYCD